MKIYKLILKITDWLAVRQLANNFLHSVWAVLSLALLVPIGLYSKIYAGPAANWVNNSLVGVFYVIFWCVLIFIFFERRPPWLIATLVLLATCLVEFLQLWHPPFLEWLRSFFIGRTILGTGFTWTDFPYYFTGAGLGWLWLKWLQTGEYP